MFGKWVTRVRARSRAISARARASHPQKNNTPSGRGGPGEARLNEQFVGGADDAQVVAHPGDREQALHLL